MCCVIELRYVMHRAWTAPLLRVFIFMASKSLPIILKQKYVKLLPILNQLYDERPAVLKLADKTKYHINAR